MEATSGGGGGCEGVGGNAIARAQARGWDPERAVCSQLTAGSPAEAVELLRAVHLPTHVCLRPYHVLSSGEQHRADIARRLGKAIFAPPPAREEKGKALRAELLVQAYNSTPSPKDVAFPKRMGGLRGSWWLDDNTPGNAPAIPAVKGG